MHEAPRGPQLYSSGLLRAYRTTPVDGVPAERWELEAAFGEDPQFRAMLDDMATLARRPELAAGRWVHTGERYHVLAGAPWVPLTALVRGGPVATELVTTFVRDVAHVLVAADQASITLRSLTPSTLAITTTGTPRLLDLTLAKWAARSVRETQAGVIKGALPYLAPEVLRGEPIDIRADVFALGLIAIELATGTRVFRGADLDVVRQLQRGVPEVPAFRAGQPRAVVALIDAMTAHDREARLRPAAVLEQLALLPTWSADAVFAEVRRIAPDAVTAAIEYGY